MVKANSEHRYNVKQLKESRRYRGKSDVLEALLDSEQDYTLAEVDKLLQSPLGQNVKGRE